MIEDGHTTTIAVVLISVVIAPMVKIGLTRLADIVAQLASLNTRVEGLADKVADKVVKDVREDCRREKRRHRPAPAPVPGEADAAP